MRRIHLSFKKLYRNLVIIYCVNDTALLILIHLGSQIKQLEKNISNSSLVIFDGCAHNVHLEKIEEFNRTVFNFINDNLNE